MPEYVLHIKVKGSDQGGSRVISGLQRGLGGIATVAGGIVAANLLFRIADGISALVSNSIGAVAQIQELEIALETLVAKEIKQQEDWATQTKRVRASLTKKQREELAGLIDDYGVLSARIQEQKQRIYEWTNVWTDEPALKVQTARAELQRMENDAAKMKSRIDELQAVKGKWVTVTEKVQVGNMKLTDALERAGPKAQELLVYLRDLSLVSPYQFQDVANTYRFSMALGATTDQAKEMTGATMDMAAALGLRNEQLHRLQYNLAQAVFAGDLTMINLRQLKLVGLDLAGILEQELGMSLQEVRDQMKAGKLDSEDLAKAFSEHVGKYYAGAAERMTKTWGGLTNNLKDLMFFLGADTLGPAMDVVTGALGNMFDTLRAKLEEGAFARFGEELGKVTEALMAGDFSAAIDNIADALGTLGLPEGFTDMVDDLSLFGEAFEELKDGDIDGFITNMAAGIARFAGNVLGLDGEQIKEIGLTLKAWGDAVAAFAIEKWDAFVASLEPFKEAFNALKEGNIDEFIASFAEGFQVFLQGVLGLNEVSAEEFATVLSRIMEAAVALAEGIGKLVEAGATAFFDWFNKNGQAVAEALSGIAMSISDVGVAIGELWSELTEGGPEAADIMTTVVNEALDGFLEILQGIDEHLGTFVEDFATMAQSIKDFADAIDKLPEWLKTLLFEDVGEGLDMFIDKYGELPSEMERRRDRLMEEGKAAGEAITGSMITSISENYEPLKEGVTAGIGKPVVDGMATAMGEIQPKMDEISIGVTNSIVDLEKDIEKPLGDVAVMISGKFYTLKEELVGKSVVPDTTKEIVKLFEDLSSDLVNPMGEVYNTVVTKMEDILQFIQDEVPEYEGAGEDMALGIKRGIKKRWDEVVEAFKIRLRGLVTTILQELGIASPSTIMVEAGEDMMKGFGQGVRESAPTETRRVIPTVRSVGKILGNNLVRAALEASEEGRGLFASLMADMAGNLLGIALSLTDDLSEVEEQIAAIEAAMRSAFIRGDMEEHNRLLRERNALRREYAEQETKITRLQEMQQRLQFLQQQIQLLELINDYGLNASDILRGLTLGVEASTDDLVTAITRAIERLIGGVNETLQAGSPSGVFMDIGINIVESLLIGIRERWPSLVTGVSTSVTQLARQTGWLLGRGLIRAAYVEAKESERLFASVLVEIGSSLLSIGMGFGRRYEEAFLTPLEEQLSSIEQAMADAKREGQLHEYLALEQRRNELAAEYEAVQERILRLEEQRQRMQFLQEQIQLLELISEHGLNVEDILGGMTLGLEASTEDLIDAITRALAAIINRTEQELQLGSPSRLFMRFGRDIMQGLARGISSVDVRVPAPAYADNGNGAQMVRQRNVTFNQTMNVHTQARSPEVQRDWGIMVHMAPTFSR